jgi:hypothetical protein
MSTVQHTPTTIPQEHATRRLMLVAAAFAAAAIVAVVAILALSSNSSSSSGSTSAATHAGSVRLYAAPNNDRGNGAAFRAAQAEQQQPEPQTPGQRP